MSKVNISKTPKYTYVEYTLSPNITVYVREDKSKNEYIEINVDNASGETTIFKSDINATILALSVTKSSSKRFSIAFRQWVGLL